MFLRNIFRRKKKDVIPDPLDVIVERYIKNEFINIPLLPDIVERRIYKSVLKSVFENIDKVLESRTIDLMGHNIFMNLKIDKDFEKKKFKKPSASEVKEKHNYIDSIVKAFVSKNNIIFLLPEAIEYKLFKNILLLIDYVIEDLLKSTSIQFMDNLITFQIKKLKFKNETINFIPIDPETDKIIEKMTDDFMVDNNIFLVPDALEKHVYKMSFTILIFFFRNILSDTNVNFLNHTIAFESSVEI